MTILKNILYISFLSLGLLLSSDDEIKTIEIDGTLYKINSSSLNISPYDNDSNEILIEVDNINSGANKINKNENADNNKLNSANHSSNLYINTGILMPYGSEDRTNYSNGTSLGFTYILPKTFKLFNNEISTGIELNFASLSANVSAWPILDRDLKFNSIAGHFMTTFGTPIEFDLGLALTDHSRKGIGGSVLFDVTYKLPIDKIDLGVSLRLQKVVEVTKDYEIEFDAQDLIYGINLKFGRTINF